MYVQCRRLHLPNNLVVETPILLPSFSSKGFPELKKIISIIREQISEPVLFSAYDINHKEIQRNLDIGGDFIVVDSGGYEASTAVDFLDYGKDRYRPKKWTRRLYERTIKGVLQEGHTTKVIISYDHPRTRKVLREQIRVARADFSEFRRFADFGSELLIKPELRDRKKQFVPVEKIIRQIREFRHFNIIGFAENELGSSVLDRLCNVAKIRRALNRARLNIPIHIFGTLDPISTPLYFMCGADIFDSLAWLRFAYRNDLTIYQRNFWMMEYSFDQQDHISILNSFGHNLMAIRILAEKMRRFADSKDLDEFGIHASLFKRAINSVQTRMRK